MSYFRQDDRTHFKTKVRGVSWACRGLVFSAAGPYCSQGETDGILELDFEDLLVGRRSREGRRAFREAIERGFIHRAGELCERCLHNLSEARREPPTEGWYLHDYLEHNPSKLDINERRRGARERQGRMRGKQAQQALPWETRPPGHALATPPAVTGVEGGSTETTEEQPQDHAPAPDDLRSRYPWPLGEVLYVLSKVDRWAQVELYAAGIESIIAAEPGKAAVKGAHLTAARGNDPGFRTQSPIKAFSDVMVKLDRDEDKPAGSTGQNVLRIDRRCRRCRVREVKAGYGAYCEQCSEELAS